MKSEWIKASDRLPAEDTDVLAVKQYRWHVTGEIITRITIAKYKLFQGIPNVPSWQDASHYDFNVDYWMPLPELPS